MAMNEPCGFRQSRVSTCKLLMQFKVTFQGLIGGGARFSLCMTSFHKLTLSYVRPVCGGWTVRSDLGCSELVNWSLQVPKLIPDLDGGGLP